MALLAAARRSSSLPNLRRASSALLRPVASPVPATRHSSSSSIDAAKTALMKAALDAVRGEHGSSASAAALDSLRAAIDSLSTANFEDQLLHGIGSAVKSSESPRIAEMRIPRAASPSKSVKTGTLLTTISKDTLLLQEVLRTRRLRLRLKQTALMAGVAINSGVGFCLQRTVARARERRPAAPVSKEAEGLVCRSLGIVQDGKDITKQALDELGRRFESELSPAAMSALRALFKLDDEQTTTIEDALISRGGQAALDHEDIDATGVV